MISIHAPTGGATVNPRVIGVYGDKDFNPRSHGGSDGKARHGAYLVQDFNPRSHGGSDLHK